MKKTSKFQERLNKIAKNYVPEEDRGSVNDKLNLHKMDETISGGGDGRASQTAQPPNFLNLQRWVDVKTEKPPYYSPINIWCGDPKEVLFNWSRVSNGDKDYYVNAVDEQVIYEISHWSPPPGVIYPKYEPMTAKDLPGYELTQLINAMRKHKIPYQHMVSWDRQRCEGVNDGIDLCIKIIERKLKKVSKGTDVKLHNRNTGT